MAKSHLGIAVGLVAATFYLVTCSVDGRPQFTIDFGGFDTAKAQDPGPGVRKLACDHENVRTINHGSNYTIHTFFTVFEDSNLDVALAPRVTVYGCNLEKFGTDNSGQPPYSPCLSNDCTESGDLFANENFCTPLSAQVDADKLVINCGYKSDSAGVVSGSRWKAVYLRID